MRHRFTIVRRLGHPHGGLGARHHEGSHALGFDHQPELSERCTTQPGQVSSTGQQLPEVHQGEDLKDNPDLLRRVDEFRLRLFLVLDVEGPREVDPDAERANPEGGRARAGGPVTR